MTVIDAAPAVADSTLLGMYLMEMVDAGASATLMIHNVPEHTREHVLVRLVENGWTRNDNPENRNHRGAHGPNGAAIHLWSPWA